MAMYGSEKKQEALKSLGYLWRTDDPDWLAQRKAHWRIFDENDSEYVSAKERKTSMRYFVYGEQIDYLDPISQYLLTPYTSSAEARIVFLSNLFGATERKTLFNKFTFSGSKFGKGMPWIRQHIKYFVDGVLGHEYKEVVEKRGGREYVVSPDPTYWCKEYMNRSLRVLNRDVVRYDGCLDTVDYFASALKCATKPKFRRYININKLFDHVDSILSMGDDNSYSYELAEKLKAKEAGIRANWAINNNLDQ